MEPKAGAPTFLCHSSFDSPIVRRRRPGCVVLLQTAARERKLTAQSLNDRPAARCESKLVERGCVCRDGLRDTTTVLWVLRQVLRLVTLYWANSSSPEEPFLGSLCV